MSKQAKKVSRKLSAYQLDQIATFGKSLTKVRKSPKKKVIHKLRLAVRRIRTIVTILEDNKIKALTSKEKAELKALWETTGEVRDLQVAMKNAEELKLEPKKLSKRKDQALKKIEKVSQSIDVDKLQSHLLKGNRIVGHKTIDLDKTVNRLRRKLDVEVVSFKDFHHFRIVLKKIRYLLEGLGMDVKNFGPIQDVLGEVHDLQNLQQYFPQSSALGKLLDQKFKKARKVLPKGRSLAQDKLSLI